MRVEFGPATSAVEPLERLDLSVAPTRRRRGLDRFDLCVLLGFIAISLWVLGLDLYQVIVHDRVWTGTDGLFLTDQMQYVAWIRDASTHGLAANLFVLHPTPADYFQPVVVVSGGLTALGIAPWLSLLLWKPVAVLAAFFAIRQFAHYTCTGLWERRVVLLFGLFFGWFWALGDLWTAFWSWGYPFGLLGIAAELAAVVAYDRARRDERFPWLAMLFGAIASAMHPWQGETLILIVIGTEIVLRARREDWRRRLAVPVAMVAATALPLVYYAGLQHLDLSWELARDASKHTFPLSHILLALAPLIVAAAFAYRRRPQTFIEGAIRAWPIAALVVYGLSETDLAGTPLHAFAGLTVPLSVLAIEGVKRLGFDRLPHKRLIAGLVVAAFTIPATVELLSQAAHYAGPTPGNANFITEGESDALNWLNTNPQPGGVLTRSYLGTVVPGATGRRSYVGDCLWSQPNCYGRVAQMQDLFDGSMPAAQARSLVETTHARFLLADCTATADLSKTLGKLVTSVHQFGCARVYTVG
jgi:hypothetical protein